MNTITSQHLDLSCVVTTRAVRFSPAKNLTCGSRQRAGIAIRLVKSTFRQKLKCVVSEVPCGISIIFPEAAEVTDVCAIAEQRLQRLQQEPLTTKMVEEILSVTPAELRCWTKQGRIPPVGRAFFSQGRKQVGVFVYAPEVICQLANQSDQISEWRRSAGSGGDALPQKIVARAPIGR
ncbi:hypothetical protein [Bradyrhizobium neotropicale]|uniref:DNA-binding protein n=1 Tax=Bradyrhizobium neotropicale TaxID=1497615 RepID=A0A176ZG36_9BRAD|nr:hypothetical protein [Bradyrhizobium neotropicale]OAF19650.1 hypothetical protein AXW67_36195 [Bradyrhizobium neotropicale]